MTELTGGTEGSPKLYEKMAQAGIGTIVGMHISEENKKDLTEISIIELIEAFKRVLKEEPPENFFYVAIEKMSVNDKIAEIIEKMKDKGNIVFQSLFTGIGDKHEVILTFLALLELIRLKVVRVIQATPFGTIRICPVNLTNS